MASKITYDDKISLTKSALPRANKCTDDDLNEIKRVVNDNADSLDVVMPIGSIITYAGNTSPNNWLICDGSAISRNTYNDLFSVIGTTFGQGDGFTTFNLPNLKGKVVVGKDENDEDFDMLGETGGEKEHTLTIDEMPAHKHGATNFIYNSAANPFYIDTSGTGKLSTATSQIEVDSSGGGQPHNILQPYIVLNYIIKAVKEE